MESFGSGAANVGDAYKNGHAFVKVLWDPRFKPLGMAIC